MSFNGKNTLFISSYAEDLINFMLEKNLVTRNNLAAVNTSGYDTKVLLEFFQKLDSAGLLSKDLAEANFATAITLLKNYSPLSYWRSSGLDEFNTLMDALTTNARVVPVTEVPETSAELGRTETSSQETDEVDAAELGVAASKGIATANERVSLSIRQLCLESFAKYERVSETCRQYIQYRGWETIEASVAVARALMKLNDAGLLSSDFAEDNVKVVFKSVNPLEVAGALIQLHEKNLLSGNLGQANRETIIRSQPTSILYVGEILIQLDQAGLLSSESAQVNRDAVIQCRSGWELSAALKKLAQAGLLSRDSGQLNFNVIAKHLNDSLQTANVLIQLDQAGLLSSESAQVNRDAVTRCSSGSLLSAALKKLAQADLLSRDSGQLNFNVIAYHSDPSHLADVLIVLEKMEMRSEASAQVKQQEAFARCGSLWHVSKLFCEGLPSLSLTKESWKNVLQGVLENRQPDAAANVLILLAEAGLLPGNLLQVNLDAVFKNPNPGVLADALENFKAMQVGHSSNDSGDRERYFQGAVSLIQNGIQLTDKHKTLVLKLAKENLERSKEISWDSIYCLGIVYTPKTDKHPIHSKISAAMKSGALKTMLAGLGVTDPTQALQLVYKLLSSSKNELYGDIQGLFERAGKAEMLSSIRSASCDRTLQENAKALAGVLGDSNYQIPVVAPKTASTWLGRVSSNTATSTTSASATTARDELEGFVHGNI